jgi:manganese/zinc/iron transport system permease protein
MIPDFDFQRIFADPWTVSFPDTRWILLMGFLVTLACGLIGNFLVLRRMALVGDAISHSILPGIAVAFLLSKDRGPVAMFSGALAAGVVTTLLIEFIHSKSRIKQDAAIGIVFSTLFAIGVILISLYAGHTDLDADCVLYGELGFVWLRPKVALLGLEVPQDVVVMGVVSLLVIAMIVAFYKELLVSSFDQGLATTLGIRPGIVHHVLMAVLSAVVVSAFRSVGAILVVATLILPGATAYLLVSRLPPMLFLSALHAALSAVLGLHFGLWLECSIGAAIVVVGAMLFTLAWAGTVLTRKLRRPQTLEPQPT